MVFIQQWIDSKCHIPAILGITSTLICRVVFGRDLFLIPAMVIIIAVLTVMRSRIDAAGGDITRCCEPVLSVEAQYDTECSDRDSGIYASGADGVLRSSAYHKKENSFTGKHEDT